MKTTLSDSAIKTLKQFSKGKGSYRDIAECLASTPMILVLSNDDAVQFLGGLAQAVEKKGYGNVKWSDSAEQAPCGLKTKEGRFVAQVFTDPLTAKDFAEKTGMMDDNGSFMSIEKSWAEGLLSFLNQGYGGVILDDKSDRRIVLNRATIANIYALLSIEWFASLSSCFFIFRDKKIFVTKPDKKRLVAFCYDSETAATAGLDLLKKSIKRDAGLVSKELQIEPTVRALLNSNLSLLFVNKGLPDKRRYSTKDLHTILDTIKKPVPVPESKVMSLNSSRAKKDQQELLLAPVHDDSFLKMWNKFTEIPDIFVPFSISESKGELFPEADILQHALGSLIFESGDGRKLGLVYTDHRVFTPKINCMQVSTPRALEWFFHSDTVTGVSFNLPMHTQQITIELPQGYTLLKNGMARLIGLIKSKDAFAESGKSHSELAEKAMADDNIYSSYHHASSARETGEPLDNFYFSELNALITMNLTQQVSEYLDWYGNRGKDPRFQLYYARCTSLSGQADQALKQIIPFLGVPSLAALAYLERGRALLIQKKPAPALSAFEDSLSCDPENADALLGKGLALRGMHYDSGNREGLKAALQPFQKVVSKNGYHSPEALFNIATIHLALEQWPECEQANRKSMYLRYAPICHRNLVLSMHAQGKIEEAFKEYQFLSRINPGAADGLEKYFQT